MRILSLLLLSSAFASAPPRFDQARFLAFMDHAAKFERKLLGCPEDARYTADCWPTGGILDVKEAAKIVEEAHRL
jgi:hypothetical protein